MASLPRRAPAPLLALAALVAQTRAAGATTLYERTLDELARGADAVVVATPSAERRSFWRNGRIVTDVAVNVTAVITGHAAAPGALSVRLPGGTVGDIAQHLAGAPSLDAGVPVVLFLSAPRDGARAVLSLSAGVLPMAPSPDGGVVVLPARTDGLTLLPDPARVSSPRLALPPSGMALGAFVARVREAAR